MRAIAAALACLPAVALAVLPHAAHAEEASVAIVSPEHRSEVSGSVTVAIESSGTPYLRLGAGYAGPTDWLAPVPADRDGRTDLQMPTWGYWTMALQAQACASADLDSCSEASTTTRGVLVSNPSPVLETPTQTTLVRPATDGALPVRLTGAGPARVQLVLSSGAASSLRTPVDRDEDNLVDLSALPNGDYELGASWCHPVFQDACYDEVATGRQVFVRHDLPATVTATGATTVAPTGERRSRIPVRLELDPTFLQDVTVSVFRGDTRVHGPVDRGVHRGVQEWTEGGHDIEGLRSGRHRLVFDLTGRVHGHDFVSRREIAFTVDATPVRVRSLTPSRYRFWPRADGRRGRVVVKGVSTGGDAARVRAVAVDSRGRVVRRFQDVRVADGVVRGLVWDGRDDRGRRVREGVHRFRIRTWDALGNRAEVVGGKVFAQGEAPR